MEEARTLLFIEIYFALRFLHILFVWDRNMRKEAPMFEREQFNDRSNPFKKALGFHVLLYGSSIIALLVVLILNALFGWYSPFDTVVYICFFALVGHLPFLLGWMLTVERRRKQWLVITNYKSKLTQKERKEAERKLKQTSLFKRLDRLREEQ